MPYIGTGVQDPNYFASEPGSIELEGGTYTEDRLYNSSTATVTGDITLTNNLVLARITDKGNNVTLTSDGTTRTITGSGKIESGNIVTTLPGNFTGMTGELGSVVTGSPNLNLGNATFPNGHILQVESANKNTTQVLTSTSAENWQSVSDLTVNITPQTGNNVLVLVNLNVGGNQDWQNQARIYRGSTAISIGTADGNKIASSFMWRMPAVNHVANWGGVYLDTSPGGDGSTAITYSIKVSGEGSQNMYINRAHTESDAYNFGRQNSSITVMEVQA